MSRSCRVSSTATQRLTQDYLRLVRDPVPFVSAAPLPSNIYEWHYVIKGPSHSVYRGGYYHGKLIFPKEFPFGPPSILMITPNGRFACNTRLCLSISDFHPDSWNPAWSVSSILTGLLSFMLENTQTTGSVETPTSVKRALAKESGGFNLKSEVFCELFPDIVAEIKENLAKEQAAESLSAVRSRPYGDPTNNGNSWQLPSLFVLVVFSMFAFLAKLVFRFISDTI
ncbi:Ubiquitin conjugating enzyme 6 [Fasciolopsis buskii]|uniref:Ubiquitin-conjugating enzyme E2 J2 n=1 Tax=Fasciolopsis buskii TaxID=27845 RepID=A0A8E0RQ50_9TREM|nr:Ubiquitin conjugating enzyme 6 [Fasciolopsis buski]